MTVLVAKNGFLLPFLLLLLHPTKKGDTPELLDGVKHRFFLCQECIVITKKASAKAEASFVLRRNISVLFGSQAQSIHIYYTAFSNMSRLSTSGTPADVEESARSYFAFFQFGPCLVCMPAVMY